jgi:hypothetical protein
VQFDSHGRYEWGKISRIRSNDKQNSGPVISNEVRDLSDNRYHK